jgi:hypothetical protein
VPRASWGVSSFLEGIPLSCSGSLDAEYAELSREVLIVVLHFFMCNNSDGESVVNPSISTMILRSSEESGEKTQNRLGS